MTVSIIVPLFYGKKYLDVILNQVEQCVQNAKGIKVELVLYNDSPAEKISICETVYSYKIKVFNSAVNHGIHGARVHGLEKAEGEYILFLDQDDKIVPAYLEKQLNCIGHADAVVCRAIHNNRFHYTNTHVFENVISKEFMLKKWCPIVSPGQVLIKRNSIPSFWKNNILENNGADDYFLWLLMAGEGKSFALNQEVLFEHVITGMNTSGDTNKMMDSEEEMIQLLLENHILHGEEETWLSELLGSLRRIHIKELDQYKRTFAFLQYWNKCKAHNIPFLNFFQENHIRRVAIYGAGDLGRNVELLLYNTDIEVVCFIDQNADYILSERPVYRKDKINIKVDAILMSVKDENVTEEMKALSECPVYQIDEIWN